MFNRFNATAIFFRAAIFFAVVFVFFFVNISPTYAWLSGYSNRKIITVQSDYVDEDLTDFPVYIDIDTDTDIGGNMQDTSNYYDIRFTDTSDTVLPYEEELMSITSGSATGSYWVQQDIASTTGATIYMYYGKTGDTDGSNATGVWDSNFKGVWHLGDGDSTDADFYQDSTSNNNDGQLTDADGDVTSISGQVGNAMDFTGDTDRINVGNDSSLGLGEAFTLSGWANIDSHNAYNFLISRDGVTGSSFDLGFKGGKAYVAINDGAWGEYVSDSVVSEDTWHHIVGTRDLSDQVKLYVDGVLVKTLSSVKIPAASSLDVTLGLRSGAGHELNGSIDELRSATSTRSADWIKFEHANTGGQSDFELAFSSEQENIAPLISSFFPTDNSTGVTTTVNLIITFDEAVDAETGNITLYKASDDSTVETFDVTADISGSGTDTITINPSADFDSQTEYYVWVDATAFDDSSSNSYTGITASTTWSFTTLDNTNPTISTYSPLNNATGTAVDDNLVMGFDEIVNSETGNITIYKTSDDSVFETIPVVSTTGTGTTDITINPTTDFAYETEYYVFVDATAFDDAAGNSYAGITASTTWSFTTLDTPSCPVVENTATYNAYPTCGPAMCNSGYELSGGACNEMVTSGGGALHSLFTAPSSGSGESVISVGMGNTGNIGVVNSKGTNVLAYINSQINFEAIVSKTKKLENHNLSIIGVNMENKKVIVIIESEPIQVVLNVGDIKKIDLDNDGVTDIELKYVELVLNRVELTVSDIVYNDISYENKLIKYSDSPKVYLIEDTKKRWIINEATFTALNYIWKDIIIIEDILFENGENISLAKDSKYIFTEFLEPGIENSEVNRLQEKLKELGYFNLEYTTNYYGPITVEAIVQFQLSTQIINSGDDYGAGYFGPKTMSKLNNF